MHRSESAQPPSAVVRRVHGLCAAVGARGYVKLLKGDSLLVWSNLFVVLREQVGRTNVSVAVGIYIGDLLLEVTYPA